MTVPVHSEFHLLPVAPKLYAERFSVYEPFGITLFAYVVPRKLVPETVRAVEEAYVMLPLVPKSVVALSAVVDAYGNTDATDVEVAKKVAAVGVEVAEMTPVALAARRPFLTPETVRLVVEAVPK